MSQRESGLVGVRDAAEARVTRAPDVRDSRRRCSCRAEVSTGDGRQVPMGQGCVTFSGEKTDFHEALTRVSDLVRVDGFRWQRERRGSRDCPSPA